jgi:hypothetical protein
VPSRESGENEPASWDALLAHPTLATVDPTGEVEVLSRAPAAAGAERFDLAIPATRADESVRVVVRVVVGPDGGLLGVEHLGTETSEDEELMRLLEEIGE